MRCVERRALADSEPRAERAAGPRERAVAPGCNCTARGANRRCMEPLTLAGILANSGTPFAALNALSTQPLRIRSRERSRPKACGSERLQRASTVISAVGMESAGTAHSGRNSGEFRRPVRRTESTALSAQPLRIRSRERSGPQARGSERLRRAATALPVVRTAAAWNRSLWPEFWRIPAPRSRL
jgi:hypothetical protein